MALLVPPHCCALQTYDQSYNTAPLSPVLPVGATITTDTSITESKREPVASPPPVGLEAQQGDLDAVRPVVACSCSAWSRHDIQCGCVPD